MLMIRGTTSEQLDAELDAIRSTLPDHKASVRLTALRRALEAVPAGGLPKTFGALHVR
jgi:hypothetical protein